MRRFLTLSSLLLGATTFSHAQETEAHTHTLRRELPQAKLDDPFPEGPDMKCWDYKIAGEQGGDMTAGMFVCVCVCVCVYWCRCRER